MFSLTFGLSIRTAVYKLCATDNSDWYNPEYMNGSIFCHLTFHEICWDQSEGLSAPMKIPPKTDRGPVCDTLVYLLVWQAWFWGKKITIFNSLF